MSYVPIVTSGGNGAKANQSAPAKDKTSRIVSQLKRARTSDLRSPPPLAPETFSIIVHCHLCWDWVWQRPQQFLSRLSQRHRILFVETVGPDPALTTACARFREAGGFPNITLLRIQFPTWQWGDGDFVDRERRRLVQLALTNERVAGQFQNPVQWFYDPMAVTAFGGHMNEIATVYDCMDELSKFKGAPPGIIEREQELLALADVVFTGGRKLFESKKPFNDNCHFYGCGVDVAHFGKARDSATPLPGDLLAIRKGTASTSRKVLGYFGVVDERMDYDLVAKLADANPDWSVVMVGPAVKVDPAQFPQRPNLHWLGGRDYKDLPAYCKGFDVCLMPFAMNEHTQFINPTKSLEYMATGREIVSSAVPDVISNFGSVVKVAHSHDEFIELCRTAAAQPDQKAIERGLKMASENSWESIVNKLEQHIRDVLVRNNNEVRAAA
jgi:glycosyltransferase involved in cell wall biosynthesis